MGVQLFLSFIVTRLGQKGPCGIALCVFLDLSSLLIVSLFCVCVWGGGADPPNPEVIVLENHNTLNFPKSKMCFLI